MRADWFEQNSGKFFAEKPYATSDSLDVGSSAVQYAVWVATGFTVTKVGLLASTGISASTTIDVGDSGRSDRYLDGIVSMATGDIIFAPTIKTATDISDRPTKRADEVGGHYYTSPDYIRFKATNSKSGGGTAKILVWGYPA